MNFFPKALVSFCLLCISHTSYSQRITDCGVSYYKGEMPVYCPECDYTRARFDGKVRDLRKFILERIDKKQFKSYHYKQNVLVQVFVDTLGNATCTKIDNSPENNTNESIIALNLDKVINEMPKWICAVDKKGNKQNSVAVLDIQFYNGQFIVDYYKPGRK